MEFIRYADSEIFWQNHKQLLHKIPAMILIQQQLNTDNKMQPKYQNNTANYSLCLP